MENYPSVPDLESIDLSADDLSKYVDLTPYLQIAPHAFDGHGSTERAYETYRTIGLRHLLVMGPNYCPIGVIARADLVHLGELELTEKVMEQRRTCVSVFASLS